MGAARPGGRLHRAGALHALTPGHGKTLLAAYLVGDRGTPAQAVALGVVIAFSHTAAVLGVGAAVLAAGTYVVPGVVVPVLTVVAGVVVLVLGLRLVRRRWSGLRSGEHLRDHGPGHGHGPGHADGALLLAIGLNRTGLGMVMIFAFSVGLAAVLVGLGILLVTAAPVVSRFAGRGAGRVTARLPLVSAVVVAVLGGVMTATGVSGLAG